MGELTNTISVLGSAGISWVASTAIKSGGKEAVAAAVMAFRCRTKAIKAPALALSALMQQRHSPPHSKQDRLL